MAPYQLETPLSSASGALAGYFDATNKKKRQQQEDERQARLDQQAQADTQARLGIERSNQDATNAYRKATLGNEQDRLGLEHANAARADAAAAQALADKKDADRRQAMVDTFQGQGLKYPKNWDTMKPEAKIGYLQVRLDKAMKAHDTKTATMTEGEINKVATEAEQARRDARQAKVDAQRDKDTQTRLLQGQQRIQISLDRPAAGTTLTPYQAFEEKAWEKTHNPDGTPKKAAKDPKAQPVQDRREADFTQGQQVIKAHPEHREEVVRRYAAKYQMPYDKADELFGDE